MKDYVTSDTTSGYTASVGGTTVSQTVATNTYGQADGVLLNGEEIVSYTFDDFGRLTSRQLNTDTPYNATTTFYPVSDEASTSHRVHTLNNGRETYSYGYDGNGNITSIGSGIVLRSYEYDALGQMTVEHDRYTNSTTLYTYDNGGNLLQKAVYPDFYGANGTPTITNYTYGNAVWADQLTNYNGTAITYDNSGNPLNWRDGLSFTWQNGRQLASAENASNEVTYTYNQNGIRTSKTVNGVKTTYILDENDQLMGEITGNNTTMFLYDEGGVAYGFLYNDTPYFYLFNGQGDVVSVVDEAGAVVATYNYDAWGKVISATGTMATINPIRYRGYYYDAETELYYLQTRYYDATVGRFLNADSVFDKGYSLIGFNMYTYARNAPTVFSDPTGEKIILVGTKAERKKLISFLQIITNTRLYFYSKEDGATEDGIVGYMGYRQGKGYKPIGTLLIKELINSKRVCEIAVTLHHDPRKSPTNHDIQYSVEREQDISKVNLGLSFYSENSPLYINLAHELIHAYRWMIGVRSTIEGSYWYVTPNGKMYSSPLEEILTVGIYASILANYSRHYSSITENALRLENDLKIRYFYSSELF